MPPINSATSDGDRGDGEIVPNLADRIEERPAIGADHQHAVGGVDQRHAGGEQRRKNHDGADGHAAGRLAGGDGEQADFGRGVETQPEQEADREHLPAARHHAEQRPEDAGQQAAAGEQQIELLLVDRLAAARPAKTAPDAAQDDEIDGGDGEQEKRRSAGADDAADFFEFGKAALQRERRRRDRRDRKRNGQRMAEREEQADRIRPLAFLHQLAHHIVDGGDVVGIDGMAQAEHISQEGGAKQRRPSGERNQGPGPDQRVGGQQQRVNRSDLGALIGRSVIDRRFQEIEHAENLA